MMYNIYWTSSVNVYFKYFNYSEKLELECIQKKINKYTNTMHQQKCNISCSISAVFKFFSTAVYFSQPLPWDLLSYYPAQGTPFETFQKSFWVPSGSWDSMSRLAPWARHRLWVRLRLPWLLFPRLISVRWLDQMWRLW